MAGAKFGFEKNETSLTQMGCTHVKHWYDFLFSLVREKDVAKNSN